jgi:hypothetical protein
VAANDDTFDLNEPTLSAVKEYASALAGIVVDNQVVNSAVTKKLKAKMGLFGDGSHWSTENIDRFDELMTLALLSVASSHLRHGYAVTDVTPSMLIDHACAAIETVMLLEKNDTLSK